MKNKWNDRYRKTEYVYGKAPNEFLKEKLKDLPAGKILFPADGEGRNSVFAANLGWESNAFDTSSEGKNKAKHLAKENQVSIDYKIADAEKVDYPKNSFDAIVFIFAHFPSDKRRKLHRKLSKTVKPGGKLILEAFSKEHERYQKEYPQIGGPPIRDRLYNLEEVKEDFKDFEFTKATKKEVELNEGNNHVGKGKVIRLFGTKK